MGLLLPPKPETMSTPPRALATQNLVTPPPLADKNENEHESSIGSPPTIGRTRSRNANDFRRTFDQHNSANDNSDYSDDNDYSDALLLPSVSFDEGESNVSDNSENESNDSEERRIPQSPVKKLRDLFESQDSKAYMDDPTLHEQRRKNHKVVSYPKRSLSKATLLQDESECESDSAENDSVATTSASATSSAHPESLPLAPPADWWMGMEETVDRYHSAVMANSERSDNEQLQLHLRLQPRESFEAFGESQNQLGRAMAVALFRGMEVGQESLEQKHQHELQDLREKHEQELAELKEQVATTKNTSANASNSNSNNANANNNVNTNTNNVNRNEAFRQRWKSRMNSNTESSKWSTF